MRARSLLLWLFGIVPATMLPLHSAMAVPITITEFYNTDLKHYVLITDPDEVAAIERGAAGPGWQRTGGTLTAYSAASDAPGLVAVCRFYGNVAAGGPNSHVYIADPTECASVKLDPGWHDEGIAFYIQLPANRSCAAPLIPVWRAYNNGFRPPPGFNDVNHRYSTDHSAIDQLVAQGWTDEGIVFCAVGGTAPGTTSAGCFLPVVGFSGTYNVSTPGVTQRVVASGTADAPVLTVTTDLSGGTVVATTPYTVTPEAGRKRMAWTTTHTETTASGVRIVTDVNTSGSLLLPMQPGESQGTSGPATGSYSITGPVSCSSPVTGTYHASYTFIGNETITVPAGTFNTCRFRYEQTMDLSVTCPPGFGQGAASDTVTLWAADGLGLVKSMSAKDGSTVELSSYTH